MRHRRVLEVEMGHQRHDCIVRGPGAFELLLRVTRRKPVWIALRRGFAAQEHSARDAIALAETLRYDVVITGPRIRADRADTTADHGPSPACSEETEQALW